MGYRFSKAKYMEVMERTEEECSNWEDECNGQPVHFPPSKTYGLTTVKDNLWLISKGWCDEDDDFITGVFDLDRYSRWAVSCDENWESKSYRWAYACHKQVCTFNKMEEFGTYHSIGKCLATDGLPYVVSQDWCDMGEEE